MFEYDLNDDPYILWAAAWVNTREARAQDVPSWRRRLARHANRIIVATGIATIVSNTLFILTAAGVI
jgi:hypothetical protein